MKLANFIKVFGNYKLIAFIVLFFTFLFGQNVFAKDCCFYYTNITGEQPGPDNICLDSNNNQVYTFSSFGNYCDTKNKDWVNSNIAGAYEGEAITSCVDVKDIGEEFEYILDYSSRKLENCEDYNVLYSQAGEALSTNPELTTAINIGIKLDAINLKFADFCCVPKSRTSGLGCKSPEIDPEHYFNEIKVNNISPNPPLTQSELDKLKGHMLCDPNNSNDDPGNYDPGTLNINAGIYALSSYIIYAEPCSEGANNSYIAPWDFDDPVKPNIAISTMCSFASDRYCACNQDETYCSPASMPKDNCESILKTSTQFKKCVLLPDAQLTGSECLKKAEAPTTEEPPSKPKLDLDQYLTQKYPVPKGYAGPLPACAFAGTCKEVNDLLRLIIGFGRVFFGILGTVALVMFIYGGFTWVTSFGNAEKVKKGRDIVIAAVVGIVIAFLAYTLINFLLDALTVKEEFRGIDTETTQ